MYIYIYMYIYNHLYKASFIEYIKFFLSHSLSLSLFLSFSHFLWIKPRSIGILYKKLYTILCATGYDSYLTIRGFLQRIYVRTRIIV